MIANTPHSHAPALPLERAAVVCLNTFVSPSTTPRPMCQARPPRDSSPLPHQANSLSGHFGRQQPKTVPTYYTVTPSKTHS